MSYELLTMLARLKELNAIIKSGNATSVEIGEQAKLQLYIDNVYANELA